MSRTGWGVLFIVVPILFGLISLWLGKDVNWDLRNYHYYNPYAFLNDRMGYDIAPAMLQSYLSPYLDIPFYWLMVSFPAWVVSFTLGALHGINFPIVFAITWRVAHHLDVYKRALLSLFSAGLGCFAPGFFLELGNTNHDNTLSVLVLTAVLLLVLAFKHLDAPNKRRVYLLVGMAGAVMGAAVGLKLTNAVYAIGSAVGLFLVVPTWRLRLKVVGVYGCLGVAAVLLTAGPWWWLMWDRFGNPLFPFYNDIFQSAEGGVTLRLARRPKGLLEHIGWPLVFSDNSDRVHGRFRDLRFALMWLTCVVYFISASVRRLVKTATGPTDVRRCFDRRSGHFLFVFFGASFIVWLIQFPGVYRYLIPLELLVPFVFFILLEKLGLPRRYQLGCGIAGMLIILAFFKPTIPRQRSPDWTGRYIQVDTRFLSNSDSTAVVILGASPMSFVIPAFPPSVRFLRPEGNLRLRDTHGLMIKMKKTIAQHEGPLWVMYNQRDGRVDLGKSSGRYHIHIDSTRCLPVRTNLTGQHIKLCPATRR